MEIFDIVEELEKERKKNKQLKELCDKYEEEHSTTFKIWQKDIKANKKAIEYIEKYKTEDYCDGMSAKQLLDILKGEDK